MINNKRKYAMQQQQQRNKPANNKNSTNLEMETQRLMAQKYTEQQQLMELLQIQQQQDFIKQNGGNLTNNENNIPLLKSFYLL